MVAKVLQTASQVHVRLLPWAQHKKWIPIRLMGCVHTHQERLAIERCDNLNYIRKVVEKIGEDN